MWFVSCAWFQGTSWHYICCLKDRFKYKITVVVFLIVLILFVCFMVFNITFNNISVISLRSVLLVEETGENH